MKAVSHLALLAALAMVSLSGAGAAAQEDIKKNPLRDVYFGNFHVHTDYSFDAFTNGAITGPEAAYSWAKGESIPGGGGGGDLKIEVPLDWYMVSDHAEFLGVFRKMADPDSPLSKLPIAKEVTSDNLDVRFKTFGKILSEVSAGKADPRLSDPKISKPIWREMIETADKHYQPGKFTTFAGFEWTSNPDKQNLHRVVIFKGTKNLPELPLSALDSDKPEDLWKWMDKIRKGGAPLLAIPHNGNASNGLMFPVKTSYGGSALTKEYAKARMRNEPVYEVSQIKGTSEVWPAFSPNDEFADFEIWDYTLSADAMPPERHRGGYARDAFLRGLKLEAEGKGNPFKYGLIGDSDTHNSASAVEENNYTGKFAIENSPSHRLNGPPGLAEGNKKQIRLFSSGGVAAVWAESNTREDIFAAVQRKETFATSGPRMKVRVFAGYGFTDQTMQSGDWLKQAYKDGVPMGGDLGKAPKGKAPVFLILAMKEANGANLDRIQIIKGWVKDGKMQDKIYNVALSDGRKPDASGKVPPVGNTVNAKEASYTDKIGDPQLRFTWKDPDFDPEAHAFYYVRVLQIPTPRWSTYDAKRLGIPPRKDLPVSIQERAWSSPIWYSPEG